MEYFVNNLGELSHTIVQTVSDLFSSHGRQTKSQDKCQCYRRQRIQNKIKLSGTCKNAEQCIHCPLLNIPQICPTPKGGDVL